MRKSFLIRLSAYELLSLIKLGIFQTSFFHWNPMHIPFWNYSSDVAYIKISKFKSKFKHYGTVKHFYQRLPFYTKIYRLIRFWIHPHYILLGESRYGVFVFVIYNLKYFELFRRSSRVKISLNIFIFNIDTVYIDFKKQNKDCTKLRFNH